MLHSSTQIKPLTITPTLLCGQGTHILYVATIPYGIRTCALGTYVIGTGGRCICGHGGTFNVKSREKGSQDWAKKRTENKLEICELKVEKVLTKIIEQIGKGDGNGIHCHLIMERKISFGTSVSARPLG